jgi:hypothetical protein
MHRKPLIWIGLPFAAWGLYPWIAARRTDGERSHGYVGLRPLPRTDEALAANHSGSWARMPTCDRQKGFQTPR